MYILPGIDFGHTLDQNSLGQNNLTIAANKCQLLENAAKRYQDILEAFKCELQIPFTNPKDPGLYRRRIRLGHFLRTMQPKHATSLLRQLVQTNDPLAKLFNYKLHKATREEMLNILLSHIEQLRQKVNEALRRLTPQQVERYLIDALLVSEDQFLWEIGLDLTTNEFPQALAEQIFDGDPTIGRVSFYAPIGQLLRRTAQNLQSRDAAFKQRVQQEQQRRERERQERRQPRREPREMPA